MLINLGRSWVLPGFYWKKVSKDRLFEALKVVNATRQSGYRGNKLSEGVFTTPYEGRDRNRDCGHWKGEVLCMMGTRIIKIG